MTNVQNTQSYGTWASLPSHVIKGVGIDEDGLKRCSKCKKRKNPAKDFGKHPRAKDGLQTACKECYAKYQTERRKNPALKAVDRIRINQAMAKRQDHYNELHNTARQRRRADPAERERWLADQRAWRAKDGNMARGNHTRRTRKLAALIDGPLRAATYARVIASGPCVYCGAPATTVDHVVPLARNGLETESNLVPACGSCNSSKGAKLLAEWDPVRVAHAFACSKKVAQLAAS